MIVLKILQEKSQNPLQLCSAFVAARNADLIGDKKRKHSKASGRAGYAIESVSTIRGKISGN